MSDDHARSPAPPQGERQLDAERRRGMLARVARRIRATAEIAFPAAPSLASHFTDILADHFAAIGRPFTAGELEALRGHLVSKLREAHEVSPTSTVLVRWSTAGDGSMRIDYGVAACASSLEDQYQHWVETREPPLFGAHPDARVMEEARALAVEPSRARVLDIGAGTGRNSLALARLGLAVDAIEPVPALADMLEAEARKDGLDVRVLRASALAGSLDVGRGRHALVVASEVTSHLRGTAELRRLLRLCAEALRPGGRAVINAFLTLSGYRPDTQARELGQVFWSTFFTPADLAGALHDLPLKTLEDRDAVEHERAAAPAESWPPTGWFEHWAHGEDVFGHLSQAAISLRWLVLERLPGPVPPHDD